MKRLTYKDSGVDIARMDSFKRGIKAVVKRSFRAEVLKGIGSFGSFFSFPQHRYKEPILISSADGVGTKLKIACLVNRHDSVGIDAVAMNVNDILCAAAQPLFFLDYIAFSSLKDGVLAEVVKGVTRGCLQAGCSLIGGETAQMPGMYLQGDYDLAGFCVGVAERKRIIDGSRIERGDKIIGLQSNGIHSNGYSLVRRVFSRRELKRLSGELLKPTRIYVKPVLSLLEALGPRHQEMRGISHITGGAFYDKIARILPADVNARIYKDSWPVPKIFRLIQNKGRIEDREMFHTFNMGVGMVLIVSAGSANMLRARLSSLKLRCWLVGEVVKGRKEVEVL
jgi:phosphoribosylformylglycinamidine cyclo-ligase